MQIFIRTLGESMPLILEVNPDDTIQKVKEKIHTENRLPVSQQILTHNGKPLEDNKTLQFYQIPAETNLQLSFGKPTPRSEGSGRSCDCKCALL